MITNFLMEHPWMSPTAVVLLVVLGPILGRWLVSRSRLAWWLLGASLLPVAVTTLVPVDRRLEQFCVVQWALPTPSRVELMANVVLFVAPALLLAVATRRPALALLVGTGLSAAIELVQALVPAIGRSCDTSDWTSNTIGVAIGAALGWAALRCCAGEGRDPRRAASGLARQDAAAGEGRSSVTGGFFYTASSAPACTSYPAGTRLGPSPHTAGEDRHRCERNSTEG